MKRLTDPMILAPVVTLALPVLVDSAFKGALLLAAILIAIRLLRNSSAALRHLVLLSAMAVLLVLPVLSLSLPSWRVLPAWADTQPLERLLSPIVGGDSDPLITYARETSIAPNEIPQDIRAVATAPSERSSTNWISLIVWIWLLGAAFFSLRLSLCQWSLWRLARNARPAYDSVPAAMAEDLKRAMGIRRKVQLLIHPGRTMPMTWGIFKTHLLLPEAAEHWETSRLRSVLLHELAHIKRCDSYTQLLVQLTCTLHWFNPLAWISARRIATERERACDDLVLNSGMRASDYAEHLLRIATGYENRAATNISAVAMASSCRLEGRVNDILSRDIDRRSITRRVALGISCGLVLLTLPVAMMRAVADEGTVEEQVGSVEPEADRAEPAGDSARAADTGQPILQRSFIGGAKALRGLDIRGTDGKTVRKFFRSPDGKILYVDIGAGKNSDQFFYEDFFVEEKRVAPQPDNLTNLSKAIDGGGFSLKKPVTAGSFYQPSLPVKLDPPGTSTSANLLALSVDLPSGTSASALPTIGELEALARDAKKARAAQELTPATARAYIERYPDNRQMQIRAKTLRELQVQQVTLEKNLGARHPQRIEIADRIERLEAEIIDLGEEIDTGRKEPRTTPESIRLESARIRPLADKHVEKYPDEADLQAMATQRETLSAKLRQLRASGLGTIHPRVLSTLIAINKIDRQIIEAGDLLDRSGATKD